MRKVHRLIIVPIILLTLLQYVFSPCAFAAAFDPPDLPYQPPEQSREELYQDIFMSLLLPYIQKEVDKYYSEYLTHPPMVAPYMVFVLSAERTDRYRSFVFTLKLRVDSYIGPHIPVGLDYITITVGGSGNVEIVNFEHIESYALPDRYEYLIKEGYKNPIP